MTFAIFVQRSGINTDPPANQADGRSGVRERDVLQDRSDVLLEHVDVVPRTLQLLHPTVLDLLQRHTWLQLHANLAHDSYACALFAGGRFVL